MVAAQVSANPSSVQTWQQGGAPLMENKTPAEAIRLAAEERFRDELEALRLADRYPRPPGWLLSPRLVETFVLGSREEFRTGAGAATLDVSGRRSP